MKQIKCEWRSPDDKINLAKSFKCEMESQDIFVENAIGKQNEWLNRKRVLLLNGLLLLIGKQRILESNNSFFDIIEKFFNNLYNPGFDMEKQEIYFLSMKITHLK